MCMYVCTLGGRGLSSSFLTSSAHSPNPGCHLFKFQVPTAWARDSADFSASMRTDACLPSKCIVMASVRCTPLSVWPLPLKAATSTTNSSCTPEASGAFQTLSGGAPSLLSCIAAPIWSPIALAQLLRAQLLFVNNVHLIDVTIHCSAPYFLFVKQITPLNFPNWQWRMFGLPLNTLLLTLKIKMAMQKKRENRDSWIQKGWRGSAFRKILFFFLFERMDSIKQWENSDLFKIPTMPGLLWLATSSGYKSGWFIKQVCQQQPKNLPGSCQDWVMLRIDTTLLP